MGVSAGHPHEGFLNQWLVRAGGKATLLSAQTRKAKIRDEAFQRERVHTQAQSQERTW